MMPTGFHRAHTYPNLNTIEPNSPRSVGSFQSLPFEAIPFKDDPEKWRVYIGELLASLKDVIALQQAQIASHNESIKNFGASTKPILIEQALDPFHLISVIELAYKSVCMSPASPLSPSPLKKAHSHEQQPPTNKLPAFNSSLMFASPPPPINCECRLDAKDYLLDAQRNLSTIKPLSESPDQDMLNELKALLPQVINQLVATHELTFNHLAARILERIKKTPEDVWHCVVGRKNKFSALIHHNKLQHFNLQVGRIHIVLFKSKQG